MIDPLDETRLTADGDVRAHILSLRERAAMLGIGAFAGADEQIAMLTGQRLGEPEDEES